jgi:Trypsin-co-occurring domain 1
LTGLKADLPGDKPHRIFVQVVPVAQGGEISWSGSVTDQLENRLGDVRNAIASGASAVAASLASLPGAEGWRLGEVEASFSVTLTAEAGVILSKASAGAAFEVKVLFKRDP